MKIRNFLANRCPALGKIKRVAWAAADTLVPRKTYSQHREDIFFANHLQENSCYDIGYIDVGANHPTSISNTYLLYRKGYRGFLIEPNSELTWLCRLFRPNDRVVQMGIAGKSSVLELKVSSTPTISSFCNDHLLSRKQVICASELVPVMSLDDAISCLPGTIGLLSIDVEGMNLEVLESAHSIALRSHFICIEHDGIQEAAVLRSILEGLNFRYMATLGCNQIFENGHFKPGIKSTCSK